MKSKPKIGNTKTPSLADRKEVRASRTEEDPRVESEEERSGGRIPLGAGRLKLEVDDPHGLLAGRVGRWFKRSRVPEALKAGYTITSRQGLKSGKPEEEPVETDWLVQPKRVAQGEDLIHMSIKREWYEEDQKAKQAVNDEIDAAIYRNADEEQNEFYGSVKQLSN